jgi:serine/threonine-protein kinase
MPVEVNEAESDAEIDQPDKLIGQVLASRYRIESRIGEGAMGAVYKARHVKVGRAFAVKVLHARLLEDKKVLQRFEREAELAGRLCHPNVIGVVDVGELPDGTRYMVMDFVEGDDLGVLVSEAPMPPARVIHLTRQMLEGLYHAHEHGLIHRDFKPENVIVEHDTHGQEVPRIVDFGIAILAEGGESPDAPGRLTTNGLVLGTPHYMAPEQSIADPIDHRIDLFALGIIVYELLCGKLPFEGSGVEVARANLLLDPPPIASRVPFLEVDPLLEAFARRLMAKKRDQRPPNAKAARDLLDLIARDRPAAAAVLGVPLDVARAPKDTQPVTPQPASAVLRSTLETPPQAPAMSAPVAVASASDAQRQVKTDPLENERPRRRWPLVALALAALGGVGAVGYKMFAAGTEDTPRIAEQTPAPAPAPAAAPVPAAVPAPAPAAVPAPAPAPAPEPAPAPPPEPAPATTTHAPTHKVAAATHKPPVSRPSPTPAETAPKIVPAVETHPVEAAPPPAPAPKKTMDAQALLALYKGVNARLNAYEQAHGADSAAEQRNRYRMINYMNAIATQATIDQAAATLEKIDADLARMK